MTTEWQGEERRRHPRVLLSERTPEAAGFLEAPVIDLSESGALLEVPSALAAKSRYTVKLLLPDGTPMELAGVVVRSYVHGFDKADRGVPKVKYRAAIQFVELSPEARALLGTLVQGSSAIGRKIG